MSLTRVWMPSPSFYVGNNGRRLLVVHSSEGAQDFRSLGSFFANGANQVSSHVGVDNLTRGTIGEYVRRQDSAWTAANANLVAVQAECCTPSGASANWTRADWMARPVMLANLADWLAEESKATGIPLVVLTDAQAQGTGRGVCQHSQLGAWGGSHHDCGPGFPMDYVMQLATGTAPPAAEEEDDVMQLVLDGAYRCQLVFTNTQSDGSHGLRFGCRTPVTVRVLWGDGSPAPTLSLVNNAAQRVNIPQGCKEAVVQVTAPPAGPESPLACVVTD